MLNDNELEKVSGGVGTDNDVVAYCKTCGKKVTYLGQTRIDGSNTGQFQCDNTNYNGTGKNCPAYHVLKDNLGVNFK